MSTGRSNFEVIDSFIFSDLRPMPKSFNADATEIITASVSILVELLGVYWLNPLNTQVSFSEAR
jgi:hypothetical protein